MDDDADLDRSVAAIRSRRPCSVELAAGAGKTHLIAAVAKSCFDVGERVLLLTHTNAGVDALRVRLRQMGVAGSHARVRTIDGWCFDLIIHLPLLSGVTAPPEPNWDDSSRYQRAAAKALESRAVQDMLRISYDVVIVDEYQDCGVEQHRVVVAINAVVPVAVFGDPLQALFDFEDSNPLAWSDVRATFPPVAVPESPRRWEHANRELGRWLLEVRRRLMAHAPVELSGAPVRWIEGGDANVPFRACFEGSNLDGTIVALGKFRADCAHVAKKLNGSYSVMEELEGKVLLAFAETVDRGDPNAVAVGTVKFAVNSATGVATAINSSKRRRLATGKPIGTQNEDLQPIYDLVNAVLSTPTPACVAAAMRGLSGVPNFAPYCRDAWYGTLTALDLAAIDQDTTVRSAVIRSRNQSRVIGRRPERRAISRPRLVKGLEYDHAILLDADRYSRSELYVALTRARRSVTVISSSPTLVPAEE